MSVVIYHGDCLAVLPTLPAESVDAAVTDPPYGLGFMGKEPFLGSGTTAIAAHNAGFSCIGVEREADYINLADQRIRAACKLESVE